jgi:hypothetical protein
MRESQMKKIIATAVAAAFVAPAFAADVTISGESEMQYVSTSGSTDSAVNADNIVVVSASEEVNGVTVSTSIVLDADALYDETSNADYASGMDGSSLSLESGGVKLTMGDTSGGMDAVGDYTDVAPHYGGFNLDGADHAFAVSLPSMNGLGITLSFSPEGAGFDGTTADSTGIGVKYAFAGGEVYYGQEEDASETHTAFGVKYGMNGITVAYERGNDDNGSSADEVSTGFSLTYKMGDILVGVESQTKQVDGAAKNEDETVTFIEYNLGSNVDIYISNLTNDVAADADGTAVGVEFAF